MRAFKWTESIKWFLLFFFFLVLVLLIFLRYYIIISLIVFSIAHLNRHRAPARPYGRSASASASVMIMWLLKESVGNCWVQPLHLHILFHFQQWKVIWSNCSIFVVYFLFNSNYFCAKIVVCARKRIGMPLLCTQKYPFFIRGAHQFNRDVVSFSVRWPRYMRTIKSIVMAYKSMCMKLFFVMSFRMCARVRSRKST